ncbi:MAG: hypothetical protein NZR01_06545 [Bryobacteraceae bacterium]|nr:hypothetical protein [Bryobacteraceae bacterium]
MALLAGMMAAAPLTGKPEPEMLLAKLDGSAFLDARPQACTQEGGCLITLPEARLPEVLLAPLRSHLPAAAARMMLPAGSRWMLAARGETGPLVSPEAVVPRAPRVGESARAVSVPFDLVARADRLHVAAMFLIGLMLLLGSAAIGFVVRHPAEPVIPDGEEPFIPESKILPRLVAYPAAVQRTQP